MNGAFKKDTWCWSLLFFSPFYCNYTLYKTDTSDGQRTLENCCMQEKIPQNGSVGALHDSLLQTYYFVVLRRFADYILLCFQATKR